MEKYLLPINERQEPIDFAEQQLKVFWTADEVKVEKDIQDVLVNFTEAEKHAVITTLKLFSIYETHAGDEYWGERFKKIFDGAEFHRMASVFAMFELAVHAPFYNKINQLLHIDTPEFYLSYLDDSVLKARVEHIGALIGDPDDLVSLASFSLVEGGILYSNFAFLKHYQSQGKNKLMNVVRGINFSVRDENIHSVAGAWSFKYLKGLRNLSIEQEVELEQKLRCVVRLIYEHECQIIAKLFEKGDIRGITAHQLECFVQSRLNECLKELGYKKEYEVKYNPISEWFYDGINKFQFNDFFSGQGREYNRNWDQSGFVWKGSE
jgi:ribonucleotide reductase beta subunit family protein with ferritin-like domain